MNIGNSVKHVLIQKGKNITWLAGELDTSVANASRIANSPNVNSTTLKKLTELFDIKASEFIALGE